MAEVMDMVGTFPGEDEIQLSVGRLFDELFNALVSQSQNVDNKTTKFTAFVSYCYSWYGLSCMVMALILNRTMVVASTNNSRIQQIAVNRRLRMIANGAKYELVKTGMQFIFRAVAIGFLLFNGYQVLVTFNVMSRLLGHEEGWISRILRSSGCFEYDINTVDRYMRTQRTLVMIGPSTDIYWPVFMGFCLSSFVETFLSSIEGVKPYTEAGLTIFEHSLAFQEASSTGHLFLGDDRIVRRPTEELLIICLFLTLNHLNVHIGALVNKNKYRLIPSTVIGVSFLVYFTKLLYEGKWFEFPLIIIGTFFPQLLIILVISLSLVIFVMAIFATGFNLRDLNYASFFFESDQEFQERTFFKLSDDFYTSLLNLGMLSITLAGKSSYITELSIATVDDSTWVERSIWEKFQNNLKSLFTQTSDQKLLEYMNNQQLKGYANVIKDTNMKLVSGYDSKEKNGLALKKTTVMKRRITMVQTMIVNMLQLFKGIILDKILLKVVAVFRSQPLESPLENYEQFEKRRQKVPAFLRKFVKPREPTVATPAVLIELDDLTEEQLQIEYGDLLRGQVFSENDDSKDFMEEESEFEDSDIESINNEAAEFISPQLFNELLSDDTSLQILKSHMANSTGILTRSQYKLRHGHYEKDEATKLIEVLLSKRHGYLERVLDNQTVHDDLSNDMNSKLDCVICQVNTREIITWPCKCFSICESCRLTLASKGIDGCVCCRRDVEGVSKVFIP